MIAECVFWGSVFWVGYCYFGYPAAITILARIAGRPVGKLDVFPTVSIVISAWNEEDVIAAKLDNLYSLDYPLDKVEILIGTDGSTDATVSILRGSHDPRLRVFEYSVRRGKPAVLNDLLAADRHEIILFNDARQLLAKDALRAIVKNFADPYVGCVSGELVFSEATGTTGKGVDLYWRYEKFIRDQESQVHSMLGATGAIYAIRRILFSPISVNTILDDMVIPFQIIRQGYRAVFDNAVKAYDRVADNPAEEYRRKVRTISGNYQVFATMPGMLNPLQSPVAIQLFSHKFLRVLVPFFLVLIFGVNGLLLGQEKYRLFWLLQLVFYGMALTGIWTKGKTSGIVNAVNRVCYVPYVFCLLNFSALAGFWRFVTARSEVLWQKARDR